MRVVPSAHTHLHVYVMWWRLAGSVDAHMASALAQPIWVLRVSPFGRTQTFREHVNSVCGVDVGRGRHGRRGVTQTEIAAKLFNHIIMGQFFVISGRQRLAQNWVPLGMGKSVRVSVRACGSYGQTP